MPTLDITVARSVMRLARRQCSASRCGISYPKVGAQHRASRCTDCPLHDVEDVADHLAHPISSED